MTIYEQLYGNSFKDLLENIRILREEYNMPWEIINFQETKGRYTVFLKL